MRFTDVKNTYEELFPVVKPKPVRLVETPVGTKTEEELRKEEHKENSTIVREEPKEEPKEEEENGHNEPDNDID